jgi:hypothetical protein
MPLSRSGSRRKGVRNIRLPNPTPIRTTNPIRGGDTQQTQPVRNSSNERTVSRAVESASRVGISESVRGRNRGLRMRRLRSRLAPVENSLLGQPFGGAPPLQQINKGPGSAIAERWNRGTAQTIPDSDWTTVEFGTTDFTVEPAGYSPIYSNASPWIWTIPSGLSGIWTFRGTVQFEGDTTGGRNARVLLNGSTSIYEFRVGPNSGPISVPVSFSYKFDEGDTLKVQVFQASTGTLDINGGRELTNMTMSYEGVV